MLNKISHVTTAERDRARTAKREHIEQIEKKWPAKNRRERLRHSIDHPAQTCAKATCEDDNIDAEEREGWGNSHGVISEESDASSPKTMSPECGKWLVGSDNWHSMVDGFSSNQSVERV